MPIRILHVVDNWGMGGLQNGLANLIARMAADRFEHIICAMRPVKKCDVQPFAGRPAEVICLGEDGAPARMHAGALLRTIRKLRPEIVHSRNWAGVEAVLAGQLASSCTIIHSEHGLDGNTSDSWKRICLRRVAFELADQVLAVSYQLRDLHAKRTGFSASRIRVIHNGVDGGRFAPDTAKRLLMREQLGIPPEAFCIGCVGNLTPVKDHLTVLRALALIDPSVVDWRLLLVGDGPERSRLEEFASGHAGWDRRVQFLGRSRNVPELLRAMDVYVLSSVTEGICNSLLEAMASALPVIVTAAGGNSEVVVDGESGFLFPVGGSQSLAELLTRLQDSDLRREMGCRALRRVQDEFSIDSMVQNYARLYESGGMAAV